MADPTTALALAGFSLAGLGLTVAALLRAWSEWIELRSASIRSRRTIRRGGLEDLADLRDRVRRLEAIADGRAS